MKTAFALSVLGALCGAPARAEISGGAVRIGVLNDMNGPFKDANGPGSVEAARLAVEDFLAGYKGPPFKIDLLVADHQNKPDVGVAIARKWLDTEGVDAIVDLPNSGVALAVNEILRNSHATLLASSTATSVLTGKDCSPNAIQWVTDTWSMAHSTTKAVLERGGDSWFFLTVNYALGQAIEKDAGEAIEKAGGKVLGSVKHPLGMADFSSALLQAQNSKAKVVALANTGADLIGAIKQAHEFGVGAKSGQTLAAFMLYIGDIRALGLDTAQNILSSGGFYWDLNDETRAFSRRFAARYGGMVPSSDHAGVYSATLAYLRAVAATGSDNAADVVSELKRAPFKDPLFGETRVRADGRAIHDVYLFRVKTPDESRYPFDYQEVVTTIPAASAFRPVDQGGCALVAP